MSSIFSTYSLIKLTLRRAVMLAALLPVLAGCSDADTSMTDDPLPPTPEVDLESTYLTMLISTRQSGPGSRADNALSWGDDYTGEQGNDLENYINPDRVSVALFKADGTPLGQVNSNPTNRLVRIKPYPGTPGLYQVVFNVTDIDITRGNDYIAAVVVNSDQAATAGQIDNAYFNESTLTSGNPDGIGSDYYSHGAIPMFGFLRWHMGSFDFTPGFPSIGHISLIRSVAKVEVCLPADKPELAFDPETPPYFGMAGRHLNSRGFAAPQKRRWIGKNNTKELTFGESFNENTQQRRGSATADITMPGVSADGFTRYMYLPEASAASMHPGEDPLRLYVTVTVSKPDRDPYTVTGVLFPSVPYDDTTGKPQPGADYLSWKLVRNHIYRFTITGVSDENLLIYEVEQTEDKKIEVPDFE